MLREMFKWELFGGKKPYLMILLCALVISFSGVYNPSILTEIYEDEKVFSPHLRRLRPGLAIDIWWFTPRIWWFCFPIIIAYFAYTFSYEFDKGIIRIYLLSNLRKSVLFLVKLSSTLIGILIPMLLALLIAYPLADPVLFVKSPFEVYVNLPYRLTYLFSMVYVAVGISLISAVAFRKPLYAFLIPLTLLYTLNMMGIEGVRIYIPPECFLSIVHPIGVDPAFRMYIKYATPSIIVSTLLLIISYIAFIKRDVA